MTVEVTPDKVVDLLLGLNVQVLELVHGRKLLDIETVGQDTICIRSAVSDTEGDR